MPRGTKLYKGRNYEWVFRKDPNNKMAFARFLTYHHGQNLTLGKSFIRRTVFPIRRESVKHFYGVLFETRSVQRVRMIAKDFSTSGNFYNSFHK
jgi:hypothetical protein